MHSFTFIRSATKFFSASSLMARQLRVAPSNAQEIPFELILVKIEEYTPLLAPTSKKQDLPRAMFIKEDTSAAS